MKQPLKILLPILVIGVTGTAAWVLIAARPDPETVIPEPPIPAVRVAAVTLETIRLSVRSQGTVSPRTESTLVPEVAGRIIEVAPDFASGSFFDAGDALYVIDPANYREAVVLAEAEVARAELALSLEQAEAEIARAEWTDLDGGEPPALTARVPQLAQARAGIAAARATLDRARRDLERTTIRAPYAGRVRSKRIDLGTYVTPGTPLATIYAVDWAEIRLPLADAELAFVDLPPAYRGESGAGARPRVTLRAEYAGREHAWHGRIVRTEGEIDPLSRMVHVVAQVKDPYARGDDPQRPPLAAGLFVEAEIEGRRVDDVAVVPRAALRDGDRLLVVDAEDRLRFRDVELLRVDGDRAYVRRGLTSGERICLSPLVAVTDGMRVRPLADPDAPGASRGDS